ncbi:uncharacterized protein DAT39_012090, partial [Clarias magur]
RFGLDFAVMARFGLWVAALSLVCLIAVVTSQNATGTSDDASTTATCNKYFDVDSKMCVNSVINMVFNELMQYFQ